MFQLDKSETARSGDRRAQTLNVAQKRSTAKRNELTSSADQSCNRVKVEIDPNTLSSDGSVQTCAR